MRCHCVSPTGNACVLPAAHFQNCANFGSTYSSERWAYPAGAGATANLTWKCEHRAVERPTSEEAPSEEEEDEETWIVAKTHAP